jgi:hypothetical protein
MASGECQATSSVRSCAEAKLKREYRLALARDGYVLVRCEAAVFKPGA